MTKPLTVDLVRKAIAEAKVSPHPMKSFYDSLGPAARFFTFRHEPGFITLPAAKSWADFTRLKNVYYLSCLEITDESVRDANEQSAALTGKSKPDTFRIEEL